MAPTSVSPEFDKVGYWSPNTASIDWCENNYVITPYIAEFWNSISSFAIVAVAVTGYFLLPKSCPRRFSVLMQSYAVLGIGSVLFHGTLRHKMQLLDELPMLYSATIVLFICIETKFGKVGQWFPFALTAWLIITTILFSTTTGTLQSVSFQGTYITTQLCMIYFLRVFHVQQRAIRPNPMTSTVIRLATASAAMAATVWLTDYRLCVYVNGVSPESIFPLNPQFHAWWHCFTGLAVYSSSILVIYYHYDIRNEHPSLYLWKGFFPALSIPSKTKSQ
ncbi:Alkaline ceramidase 3 [Podila clonocystis]|nr:Alkaline ceramidase 3 [Podila clonocystis]